MMRKLQQLATAAFFLLTFLSAAINAQTNNTVPRLVRFSGVARDLNGKPLSGIVGITFALYPEQTGGAPLWLETQNAQADAGGHYSVLLGSTKPDGLPAEIFASEQARWIGVQIEQQEEQPRSLLVSAPYALKAGDAETLGGLPASAFMLAASAPANGGGSTSPSSDANAANGGTSSSNSSSDVTTTGGKANTIPMFTAATNIQNSLLTQTGTTAVNVAGTLNMPALGAATSSKGYNSQAQGFVASAFNSSTSTAVPQTFQLRAEAANNDTSTASGTLNLLYGSGTATPAETGLKISNKGIITFAAGQTFPGGGGSGTVTSVGSGAGLTGGPITSSGTLSIAAAGVTNAMLQNPTLTVAPGTGLSGGGVIPLGGSATLTNTGVLSVAAGAGITSSGGQTPTISINTSVVPELSAANKFTASQTITGNVAASGTVQGGAVSSEGSVMALTDLDVDDSGTNNGSYTPGLRFGQVGNTGEAISSKRTSGGNQFGIDFYTGYTNRMSITNGGQVGIGTTTPAATLEVNGTAQIDNNLTATGVISGNGSGLTNLPVHYTTFVPACGLSAGSISSTPVNLGTIGTFNKVNATSNITIDWGGHVSVGSLPSSISAGAFYLEVDGNTGIGGQASGLVFYPNGGRQFLSSHACCLHWPFHRIAQRADMGLWL